MSHLANIWEHSAQNINFKQNFPDNYTTFLGNYKYKPLLTQLNNCCSKKNSIALQRRMIILS